MVTRQTFEVAIAKVQRLMLFDEMQDLKDAYKERRKIDIGVVIAIFLLFLKSLF